MASGRPAALVLFLLCSVFGCKDQPPASSSPTGAITRVPEPAPREVPEPGPEPEAPPEARAEQLELTFVGDLVLGHYVSRKGADRFIETAPPEADPFAEVTALLAADVVVGNLESPLVRELPARAPIRHRNRFATGSAYVGQLVRGGFTVLSLANNHHYDLGLPGQLEGPQVLAEAGLMAIGSSREQPPLVRVETLEVHGWRVAFLAFATLANRTNPADDPQLPLVNLAKLDAEVIPLIASAREDHDLVVIVAHWGQEYADDIRDSQRLAAHKLLDAGADLLIGHHPHVLQAIERHASGAERDGLVAYSLGNFLFPRNDGGTELSAVLRARYRDRGPGERPCLERAEVHPVYMSRKDGWHPIPAPPYKAAQVRQRLVSLSKARHTRLRRVELEASEDLYVDKLRPCE